MLKSDQPAEGRSLVVQKQPIELVFYEDDGVPLTAALPPYEDLAEIESLRGANFSLHAHVQARVPDLEAEFKVEGIRLQSKYAKFRSSPTFLNRLAALAAQSGDFESEAEYLKEMISVESSSFTRNKYGENLLRRHFQEEAEHYFKNLPLDENVHANLRLGSFCVMKGNFEDASAYVKKALFIDPSDYATRVFDGTLKIFSGDYHSAIFSLKVAIEERPTSAVACLNMAVAYLRLRRVDKALSCLKKSVALDPLNQNAVGLLADVANSLDASEESVPSLRYLVQFEQQSASTWARLARALIQLQEFGDAIAALKRQSSVKDGPELWNNLGVAYYLRGDRKRASESFFHAMRLSDHRTEDTFFLAAKNASALLMKEGKPSEALAMVNAVLNADSLELVAIKENLWELILIKLDALRKLDRRREAIDYAESILQLDAGAPAFRAWVASGLLSQYALDDRYLSKAISIAKEWQGIVAQLPTRKQRFAFWNNIAFVFAEAGLLDEAEKAISQISSVIHKDPYPTATLGLLHLRRSHKLAAELLYEEALKLCSTGEDRARIRQKWNLEKGLLLLDTDLKKSVRLLEKASAETQGEPALASKAARTLHALGVRIKRG